MLPRSTGLFGPQVNGHEIVSLGVDWITATTKWRDSTERMLDWASSQITVEMSRGNDRCFWAMSGFTGHRCGHVQVGFREDEGIVRLTSDYARESWRALYDLCDNVSRLDLQVTSRHEDGPAKRVLSDYRRAKRQSRKRAKGPEVTLISKMKGGVTFYSGMATSRVFGRCYDKEAQSKLKHYESCVRHETQYNGKLAMLVTRDIVQNGTTDTRIARHLSAFWRERLGVFRVLVESPLHICVSRNRPDDERRLSWLAESIGPSVRALVDHGRGPDVLRALGVFITPEGELKTGGPPFLDQALKGAL